MKKLLLAATVATLAMNAAQAAPTLYGKLSVTLDNIDNNGFKDESVVKVNSNASRLGVKGEESEGANSKAKGYEGSRDGFGDGVSASLTYENKDMGLAAAVAANRAIASKFNAYDLSGIYTDAVRVTGSLDLGAMGASGLVLGALWQTAKPTDDVVAVITTTKETNKPDTVKNNSFKGLKEDAYGVTAAYAIPSTPVKLKAQYISATTEVDGMKDRQQDLYGVGADYQINKQARFYGIVAQQKRDWLTKDDKKTNIGLGMEYNF